MKESVALFIVLLVVELQKGFVMSIEDKRSYLVEKLKHDLEAIEYISEMDNVEIGVYFFIATEY